LRPKNQEKEKKDKVKERLLKKKLSKTQKSKDELLAKQPNLGKKKDDGFRVYSNSNDSLQQLEMEEKTMNEVSTGVDHMDESSNQTKQKRKKKRKVQQCPKME